MESELAPFLSAADDFPGVTGNGHCLVPEFVDSQLEKSLQRLRVDSIDIFFLHNPEEQLVTFGFELFEKRLTRALIRCEELRREGRIGATGIACSQDVFDYASPAGFLDTLLACADRAGTTISGDLGAVQRFLPIRSLAERQPRYAQHLERCHRAQCSRLCKCRIKSNAAAAEQHEDADQSVRHARYSCSYCAAVCTISRRIDCALFGSGNPDHVKHLAYLGSVPTSPF